jgi:hypothetical protein
MDTNRKVQSGHLFLTYSAEGPARQYARQTSLTPSPLKTGDYSNSISRSVFPFIRVCVLMTSEMFVQPDSVHTVEDALAYISQPQPVQVGQLSPGGVNHQVQIEALPSVLVLHLERFLYDANADGIIKIGKSIQFAPELEIPHGTIFYFFFPVLSKAKNPSCLGWSRNFGARCREICGAWALQTVWGALPPRRVRKWRALYG